MLSARSLLLASPKPSRPVLAVTLPTTAFAWGANGQATNWTLEKIVANQEKRFFKTHANLKDLPCGKAPGVKVRLTDATVRHGLVGYAPLGFTSPPV